MRCSRCLESLGFNIDTGVSDRFMEPVSNALGFQRGAFLLDILYVSFH